MKNKKASPYIFLVVLVIIVFLVKNKSCNKSSDNNKPERTTTKEQRGLNRNPSHINYSKHAKCRMECRHIDENEVKDILQNGNINYKKSDLDSKTECNKKYAVEGVSKDNQRIRLIVAPCNDVATIVTCIDLGTDWECYCEGDEKKN